VGVTFIMERRPIQVLDPHCRFTDIGTAAGAPPLAPSKSPRTALITSFDARPKIATTRLRATAAHQPPRASVML
jgi:hypothetical protein